MGAVYMPCKRRIDIEEVLAEKIKYISLHYESKHSQGGKSLRIERKAQDSLLLPQILLVDGLCVMRAMEEVGALGEAAI